MKEYEEKAACSRLQKNEQRQNNDGSLTQDKVLELVQKAEQAARNAYAPYSGFKVGAALLCLDGEIFTGCNVESASYSLTVCAERTALVKAVSHAKRRFCAVAVTAFSDSGEQVAALPCGACRQMLSEFAEEGFEVVLCGGKEGIKRVKLSRLFPMPFTLDKR